MIEPKTKYIVVTNDEARLDVTAEVVVVPRDDVKSNGETIQILRDILAGDHVGGDRLEKAIGWEEKMGGACKTILAESDRFLRVGHSNYDEYIHELNELRAAVRRVLEGPKHDLMRLRQAVGLDGDIEHENCPSCSCWSINADSSW